MGDDLVTEGRLDDWHNSWPDGRLGIGDPFVNLGGLEGGLSETSRSWSASSEVLGDCGRLENHLPLSCLKKWEFSGDISVLLNFFEDLSLIQVEHLDILSGQVGSDECRLGKNIAWSV